MAASPVGRSFALSATRRASELRQRDGRGFGDVLAAKLPASIVTALRRPKCKGAASIVLGADGAELKIGDKVYPLSLVDEHESAYDCYREDVRSRRWDDLGPILHTLQPTRKRTRPAAAAPERRAVARMSEGAGRAAGRNAAARAMLGASGLASSDEDSGDSHDSSGGEEREAGVLPPWTPGAGGPPSPAARRQPGTARLDRAVSAAVTGGRGGRGGRSRAPRRTQEEKDAEAVTAARGALEERAGRGQAERCDALKGIRSYNNAVASFELKHAVQMQLDAELSTVAAEYSQLSDQLLAAAAGAGGEEEEGPAGAALIRRQMAAWERDNSAKVCARSDSVARTQPRCHLS